MINKNMRCIEIAGAAMASARIAAINKNMRCIEIVLHLRIGNRRKG